MKGLILAGGTGSRLRPLTYTGAKQLLPVANRPILHYALEAVVAAGITDVGMVVGDTAAEIEAACGDGRAFGCRITYIRQPAPLGLAHAVQTARPFLGDAPFLMYLGDNLLKGGVTELVQAFRAADWDAAILLTPVPHPEQFGVAVVEGGRVVRLVEKPRVPPSNLALVGVYLFRPSVHAAIATLTPSWRGELEITDALQRLIDAGRTVHAETVTGWWKDTGRPEDVLEANRLVLEDLVPRVAGTVDAASRLDGRVVVEAGARIVRSTVRGPAIIGPDALVEDSFVGPFTSLGPRVVVRETEIEHSVVMADTVLEAVPGRLDGCLLGRGVRVARRRDAPRAFRLVLGDQSHVEVL
ncbi:MAG: glucose-1-phosphate thymidylyltransferase [Actinomycetia bacterium]|nr:glucose-1-phosphate thymidylyltransferase [Actinomycetes bacterium]